MKNQNIAPTVLGHLLGKIEKIYFAHKVVAQNTTTLERRKK